MNLPIKFMPLIKLKSDFQKAIKIAATCLKHGGAVVFPTETVYGLGADPFNTSAVQKIYQLKGRDFNKPLPLIAENLKVVKKFFKVTSVEERLMKKYWPGALTIILKHKNQLTKFKGIWNQKEIAVRVSPNKIARDLAGTCGGFIISTSANLAGQPECASAQAVVKQFKNKKYQPDLILDAGRLKKSKPSTIVKVLKGGKIEMVRQGEVKI